MQDFPHHYRVSASAETSSNVSLNSEGVDTIESAPPVEFGGSGGHWSPETLLVAAVADCFVLSFRTIARASRLDWVSLSVDVNGVLDRIDRVTQFTGFEVCAKLVVPEGSDTDKADKLLHKAERACLITNSLKADSELETEITVAS